MSRPTRGSKGSETPHPIDVIAGRNLRIARLFARCSQEQLADKVGISFQQVQKYERGTNRMSISRASEFASILGISIAFFIEDADWMPPKTMLDHASFSEWMILWTRAHHAGRVSEVVKLASSIVKLCEQAPLQC